MKCIVAIAVFYNFFTYAASEAIEKVEHDSLYEAVVMLAKSYLGTPYRYGGIDRRGVDCSGLVCRVYADAAGVLLPRTADAQALVGLPISKDSLRPGDLVFFREPGRFRITHVGIVHKVENGDATFIHAASVSRRVVESRLSDPHWRLRFVGARRPLIPSKGRAPFVQSANPQIDTTISFSSATNRLLPGCAGESRVDTQRVFLNPISTP
ncbi:MAG: C40 family peptidase [Bacteroidia bacterium]